MGRFQADYDLVGLGLTVAAGMLLMFFGLSFENFAQNYWVAYAFWITGFFGSLLFGFARRSKALKLMTLVKICAFAALILLVFACVNLTYSQTTMDVWSEKIGSGAVGISEELFFGVFLIGLLINWTSLNKILVIIISAASHAGYHYWIYGTDFRILSLFFVCFVFARATYVFVFPKVGMLLSAHGVWNFLVSGGAVVKHVGELAVAWMTQRLDWVWV